MRFSILSVLMFSAISSSAFAKASAPAKCSSAGITRVIQSASQTLSSDVLQQDYNVLEDCIVDSNDRDVRRQAARGIVTVIRRGNELETLFRNLP